MAASLCECPLCQATFQATPEMAGTAVQCPSCARALQLPDKLGVGGVKVCQAIRIDVCTCPDCKQGFGYTTQMLETVVACPHCSASFRLRADGNLVRNAAPISQTGSQTSLVAPPAPSRKSRFRELDESDSESAGSSAASPGAPAASDSPIRIVTGDKSRSLDEVLPPIQVKPGKPGERNPEPSGDQVAKPQSTQPAPLRPVQIPGNVAAKPKATSDSAAASGKAPPALPTESPLPRTSARLVAASASTSETVVNLPDQPPRFSGSKPEAEPQGSQLLPPKFFSSDPTIIRQRKVSRSEQPFVLLPDAKGGFQRVNNTVIRIQHEGETIVLAAPDPKRVRQRRLIVNLVTLAVCLAILYFVFRSLL